MQLRAHDLSHSPLQVLFLLTVQRFSVFNCKEYNHYDIDIDHLVMSMCRVFSFVVGRGCLPWPACFLGKILLAFDVLHFVLQGQICLFLQVSLDFLLLYSSSLRWKGYLLVLETVVGLHRVSQLQLLWSQWLGHRLGLL